METGVEVFGGENKLGYFILQKPSTQGSGAIRSLRSKIREICVFCTAEPVSKKFLKDSEGEKRSALSMFRPFACRSEAEIPPTGTREMLALLNPEVLFNRGALGAYFTGVIKEVFD
jgi:hypothetical protein